MFDKPLPSNTNLNKKQRFSLTELKREFFLDFLFNILELSSKELIDDPGIIDHLDSIIVQDIWFSIIIKIKDFYIKNKENEALVDNFLAERIKNNTHIIQIISDLIELANNNFDINFD